MKYLFGAATSLAIAVGFLVEGPSRGLLNQPFGFYIAIAGVVLGVALYFRTRNPNKPGLPWVR